MSRLLIQVRIKHQAINYIPSMHDMYKDCTLILLSVEQFDFGVDELFRLSGAAVTKFFIWQDYRVQVYIFYRRNNCSGYICQL